MGKRVSDCEENVYDDLLNGLISDNYKNKKGKRDNSMTCLLNFHTTFNQIVIFYLFAQH